MKLRKRVIAMITLLGAANIFFASYSFRAITAEAPYERLEGRPTILIDAGHGSFDGGAVGVGGIVEKEINLAISKKLYDIFQINGFDVVMMRTDDQTLEDQGLNTTRKKKISDIKNRLELAKTYDNSILLSIHQNKYTRPQYWGAQVFYGPKNSDSEALAKAMQQKFVTVLQPENTRQYKVCGDNVYLIYNAPMPSLLVECGFLSNPEEAKKLIDPTYQKQVAFTIFSGVCSYLGMELDASEIEQERL